MATVSLYNSLYQLLSTDPIILSYLQIDPADALTKAKRIQRRMKPVDPVNATTTITNFPLISFYNVPGNRETANGDVFRAPFLFDVYTSDDVTLALNIQERIFQLLEGNMPVGEQLTLASRFLDGFESTTDLLNTYCYTQVFELSVSLDPEDR